MMGLKRIHGILWFYMVAVAAVEAAQAPAEQAAFESVVMAVRMEDSGEALAKIDGYLESYPDSKRVEELRVLRLSVFFDNKEYQRVLREIEEQYSAAEVAEEESVSYMLVGALCFSGDVVAARQAADTYLKKWQAGSYVEDVRYFKATSLARLGYAEEARALLLPMQDEDAVGFEYLNSSMYELARLDFGQGNYAASNARLEELLTWLTDEELQIAAHLLLGQGYAVLRERELAEKQYLTALELVREFELAETEEEVLFYLVDFYGRELIAGEANTEMSLALPYYREFFEKFPKSEYAAQVATVALPALMEAGELELGVQNLEAVVRHCAGSAQVAGLKRAASGLIWKLVKLGETPQQLRLRFGADEDLIYVAIMRHALAGVYHAGLRQAQGSWGKRLRYSALADALYAEILAMGNEVDMPIYVRLDLAWWLLEKEGDSSVAEEQFRLALRSDIWAQKDLARVGLAAVLLRRANAENLAESARLLADVMTRSQGDEDLLELVVVQQLELLDRQADWVALTGLSRKYLIDYKFTKSRARVDYLLAKSYDKRGMVDDAIVSYTRIFASHTNLVEVSAPALERLTALTWQRNGSGEVAEASDRQIAYQLGHRYLTLIEIVAEWRKERDGVKSSLDTLRRNVAAWEASGEVKPVSVLLDELRKSRY